MRRVALVALAIGCGAPPAPRGTHEVRPPDRIDAGVDAPVALEPPPIVHRLPARPIVEAPPDGAIHDLALSADGSAALTADAGNGIRLWPSLDGLREPVVLDLPDASDVALGRRSAGFLVALVDDVGGLVIAQVASDGQLRTRVSLAPEPVVTGVAVVEAGVLAWRADQTIALYGPEGVLFARLAAEPGQHLDAVLPTAAGALAIVTVTSESGGTTVRARALAITPHALAWAAWGELGFWMNGPVAVSPDGKHLAQLATVASTTTVIVVELATGRDVTTAQVDRAVAIGFADDAHVAALGRNRMTWVSLDGTPPADVPSTSLGTGGGGTVMAAAHGAAVIGEGTQLAIATASGVQWLGYDVASINLIAPGDRGTALLTSAAGGLGRLTLVDARMREMTSPAYPTTPSFLVGAAHLAGDDWLIESVVTTNTRATLHEVVDLASGSASTASAGLKDRTSMVAEATTRWIGLSSSTQPRLLRYDPATHATTVLLTPPPPASGSTVYFVPVAPSLAGGTRVVRATMHGGKLAIEWLSDEIAPATTSLDLDEMFITADRAGHVYTWQRNQPSTTNVAVDGKHVVSLPDAWHHGVWPDPEGARVAIPSRTDVALYKLDGTLLWRRALPNGTGGVWTDDTTIAIIVSGGVVQLDARTGDVKGGRCGWHFTLGDRMHPNGAGSPVCARLR